MPGEFTFVSFERFQQMGQVLSTKLFTSQIHSLTDKILGTGIDTEIFSFPNKIGSTVPLKAKTSNAEKYSTLRLSYLISLKVKVLHPRTPKANVN